MMSEDEKDRFGDKLRDAERGREDQFFADRDRAILLKLKAQTGSQEETSGQELAHAQCPSDTPLTEQPQKPMQRKRSGWLSRMLRRAH
jgi:hypothetical protein